MSDALVTNDYLVKPGHLYVAFEPSLIRCVLGACVSVAIWDRRLAIGGMTHFIRPRTRDRSKATAQYGNVGMSALVRILEQRGSRRTDLEAQIFGGAHHPSEPSGGHSDANVKQARKSLKRFGIPVVSEDIGGVRGRKLVFDTRTGHAAILKVHRIRRGDWFPLDLRLQRLEA